MNHSMNCRCLKGLPKLSWIAVVDFVNPDIHVYHGQSVEIHDSWIVEGVWDGEFIEGKFHQSENFFGSGVRIDNGKIYFVPSSSVVDRIFYCYQRDSLIVANSLINLLAITGASLDSNHDYWEEATSIFRGDDQYQKEYRVIHPDIKSFYQVYYENIVFSKGRISYEPRNKPLKKIESFDEYHEKLTDTLKKISSNYKCPQRQHRVDAFTTISSGYDSTAVSALVKDIGVVIAFTAKKSNSWLPALFKSDSTDDGTPIAQMLGLNTLYLDGCENISEDELFFWAGNYARHANQICLREIFYHSMFSHIQSNCQAAVVFTGQSGDKIWNINTPDSLISEHVIRDTIDQNLSEIRLQSGLINIPVPFLMVRNIKDIVGISRSEVMRPWRLSNDYDRPIPRRIAETAGVKRGTFALKKKGAATTLSRRYPYNKTLRKRFFAYLKNNHGIGPGFVYVHHYLNQSRLLMQKVLSVLRLRSGKYKQTLFWKDIDLTFYLWLWSVDEIRQKMIKVFEEVRQDP